MKRFRKINCLFLSIILLTATVFCSTSVLFNVRAEALGYVDATDVNIRRDATTGSPSLGHVSNANVIVNGSKVGNDGYTWYNITYNSITGYVRGDFVKIYEAPEDKTFEQQIEAFPESYKQSLRNLHGIYPNWQFYADPVPLSFNETLNKELANTTDSTKLYKSVHNSSSTSWKSMGQFAYDWTTNRYMELESGWVAASREIIAYYLDPRNFLNTKDIYTFMQQSYNPQIQNEDGVARIIKGTFLENGYSDPNDTAYGGSFIKVIMEAAKQSGVSPYVIAATIKQEQGVNGTSSLISGTCTDYSGQYYGYYNFFNVKATGSDVVGNGLNYAKIKGWSTRSASIIGGASFVANGYITSGQDTYYYINYDVLSTNGYHQYATAVHNAVSSGRNVSSSYSDCYDAPLIFRIPVYNDLPESPAACPEKTGKRNNYYFTSISVPGLTPTFRMYNYNYDLQVSGDTVIDAVVPDGATIVSPATYSLSAGETRIVLTVKSESGYTTDYIINVNALASCTVTVPGGVGSSSPNPDPIPTEPDPETPKVMKGDTNGDGKINGRDLANIQMHILSVKFISGEYFEGADTNSDGKINGRDLANVQMHILGIKYIQ